MFPLRTSVRPGLLALGLSLAFAPDGKVLVQAPAPEASAPAPALVDHVAPADIGWSTAGSPAPR
jgi:hypothetical protein